MAVRRGSTRSALTVAGAAVATVLAALLALAVNVGILRAAGSPSGPGRLDQTSVERPVPAPAAPLSPEHKGRAHEDQATPHPSLQTPTTGPSWTPQVTRTPSPSSSSRDGTQRGREFGSHADD